MAGIPGIGKVVGNVVKAVTPGRLAETWANNAINPYVDTHGSSEGRVIPLPPFGGQPSRNDSSAPSGPATGSGYASGSGATAAELAYFDAQRANAERQLGRTDRVLNDSLTQLVASYNQGKDKANKDYTRVLEKYGNQRTDTDSSKDRAIDKVNTNARVLADSLRRRIGMAGGSSSSAYQITAPNAVARQASGERTDVLGNFAANYRDLDAAERYSKEDYDELLRDLDTQRNEREMALRRGVDEQRIDINETLREIAAQRAAAAGGGYEAARSAMAPYESAIAQRESSIDDLFNQYGTKAYNVRDLAPKTVNLRDYMVDKAAIQANQQSGSQDPYAPYGNQLREDDEEQIGL